MLGAATDAADNQFGSLGLRMGGSEVASRRNECANGKLANTCTVKEVGRARGGELGGKRKKEKRDRHASGSWRTHTA